MRRSRRDNPAGGDPPPSGPSAAPPPGGEGPDGPLPLTEGQRRALFSSLLLLDDALADVEELLAGRTRRQLTDLAGSPVPDARRHLLQTQIDRLRCTIDGLARDFGLAPRSQTLSRLIIGILSARWSDLEDTRPARLRAYGSLHPDSEQRLVTGIDALIQEVRELMAQAKSL